MNEYELNISIDWIRELCKYNQLELVFLVDSNMLIIVDMDSISNFSLSNLKKLLSVVKKEELKIKKIMIKF